MRRVKIGLFVVAGLLAALVAPVVVLFAVSFSGIAPLVDGQVLPGDIRVVEDGHVATFLAPIGDGKYVLIDAGNDPTGAPIEAALTALGATRSDVSAILLTHAHPDHTAACDQFPSASIYALRAELPLLAGQVQPKGPLPRMMGMDRAPCADRIEPTDPGAAVALGRTMARPFALPGHTPGSAAWLVHGVLFFGDAATASDDGEIDTALWLFSDDQAEATRSLVALADQVAAQKLDVQALAFAHSGPLTGGGALAAFAAAHR